jgi:hypothetical protein
VDAAGGRARSASTDGTPSCSSAVWFASVIPSGPPTSTASGMLSITAARVPARASASARAVRAASRAASASRRARTWSVTSTE